LAVFVRRFTGATMLRSVFREFFVPIPLRFRTGIRRRVIALVVALQAEVAFVEEPLIKYQHSF